MDDELWRLVRNIPDTDMQKIFNLMACNKVIEAVNKLRQQSRIYNKSYSFGLSDAKNIINKFYEQFRYIRIDTKTYILKVENVNDNNIFHAFTANNWKLYQPDHNIGILLEQTVPIKGFLDIKGWSIIVDDTSESIVIQKPMFVKSGNWYLLISGNYLCF
jgi:hypothetical protein